ncbi:hypothetical protein [Desulfosarcina alkanivorans]|nr:hypothetical protein [Desulfosarcina alkanivorans]
MAIDFSGLSYGAGIGMDPAGHVIAEGHFQVRPLAMSRGRERAFIK